MGRNVVVGLEVGGWFEINCGLIGSMCTRLWLCHLFAVPKFPLRMRKMTENMRQGRRLVRRIECLVGAAWIGLWAFNHILRNSPKYNIGIGKDESNCCTPFLIFRHFRKITKSFVLSVCLSSWNNSAPTGRIFMKLDVSEFFENLSGKFKFH